MDIFKLKYRIKKKFIPTSIKSEEYLKYLKSVGVRIGDNTVFFYPCSNSIDIQRPWLLKIGDYCKITEGVTILTHDYSRSVLRLKYGPVIGEARETSIGDNVFIGMKSTILMGANIGDNVIIGAGSVVSGTIPSDCVAAGVPAKVICTLDNYYKKRVNETLNEAVIYTKRFISYHSRRPTVAEMGPFYPLFLERKTESLRKYNVRTHLSGDNEEDIISNFLKTKPMFTSFDEFLEYVDKN